MVLFAVYVLFWGDRIMLDENWASNWNVSRYESMFFEFSRSIVSAITEWIINVDENMLVNNNNMINPQANIFIDNFTYSYEPATFDLSKDQDSARLKRNQRIERREM